MGPQIPDPDEPVLVRSYSFVDEADRAKSLLDAFGVLAFVREAAPRGDLSPQLLLRRADLARALELLDGRDHSADLASVPEAHLPPAPDELCPRCGSEALERVRRNQFDDGLRRLEGMIVLMLTAGQVRWGLDRGVRCRSCGQEWRR